MADFIFSQSGSGLEFLPNELLLDIISLVCSSQTTYRALILVNKRFHTLVKYELLPHIPIRLNVNTVRSFSEFITADELAGRVRYLWINGTSILCSEIATSCTNLVALACSKTVLHALFSTSLKHANLIELTLFDNWRCWDSIFHIPHRRGIELCQQITHLRLHEPISEDFMPELFPSLSHFSYSETHGHITSIHVIGQLAPVHNLSNLERIVITTFFWADEPADERTRIISLIDNRIRILYFGSNEPGEFTLWCGRARKTESIWTRQSILKRLL